MGAFFSELSDEGGIGVSEALAEFFELLVGDVQVPGGFDGSPALLKLGIVGFAEMIFGVALHMHGTELDVSIGEKALSNGQETGEVVLH